VHDVCKKKQVTFSGKNDSSEVIAFSTPELVEEKAKEILRI